MGDGVLRRPAQGVGSPDSLKAWYQGRFAEFQRRAPDDRSGWWRWCGRLEGRVLDLGCGPGVFPGAIGVDLAFGHVRADALRLPFADGTFDAVVTSHLIEHVDPVACLREIRRVLRNRGRLFVETPELIGVGRALRVYGAGARDRRYPCGGRTMAGAVLAGLAAWRHVGRVVSREPWLNAPWPGKDPDAVWWCNGLALARLLLREGFELVRASGWMGHTWRAEAFASLEWRGVD